MLKLSQLKHANFQITLHENHVTFFKNMLKISKLRIKVTWFFAFSKIKKYIFGKNFKSRFSVLQKTM